MYAKWIVKFLLAMQAVFRLTDAAVGYVLRFLKAFFSILSHHCKVLSEISQSIPNSMYKVKQLSTASAFQRYVVCKNCNSIYLYSECIEQSVVGHKVSRKCSYQAYPHHPHSTMRSLCGTLLLKTVELSNHKIYLYPYLLYCYLGLDISLQSLFNRTDFFNDCEKWRSRITNEEELYDIYDGKMWKKFICYENEPFLSEAGNLGLLLNFDFFQPYNHVSYSLGALYMSILNLPHKLRYKRENMILIGLIPGPHEPRHDINSFLKPLVNDLTKLWRGVNMNIASMQCVKKIRCALICVACDIPAGRKICGFLGHNARLGCTRCLKEFTGGVGSKDYSGFDRQKWTERTREIHNANAFRINNLTTVTAIENAESSSGCRYSELLMLPYFDAPKMLIIDPMHNLYLGTAKYFFKNILLLKGYIAETHLSLIQEQIDSFVVPPGIDKIRIKVTSGFSQLTADQWKNWVIYFSLIALRDIVSKDVLEIWRFFVFACRTLCAKTISLDNIKLADAFFLQFCRCVEYFFGKDCITPNMHLHCHLAECIEDYGPVYGFWCFPFERYNGLLGSTPNNNRSIECQIMQRMLRENEALHLYSEDNIPESLLHCFPQMQHAGSVAETMVDPDIIHNNETNSWTLDNSSSESVISLPKCKTHYALRDIQKRKIVNMYKILYKVDNVEIAQTCFAYKSLTINGYRLSNYKNKSTSASIVMTYYDPLSFRKCATLRAARINQFYKHCVTINNEVKSHLLAYLSWYLEHPKSSSHDKPVTIWYQDLFQANSIIPVQLINSRAVSLVDELSGDSIIFVVPCLK